MLEKDIEKKVCEYAKTQRLLVYKFTSPNRAAVPDRLFITSAGVVFLIEFKAPGKTATQPQQREHERLRAYGVKVFVVDDVTMGKMIIQSMLL